MQFVEDPNGQIKARTRHKVPFVVKLEDFITCIFKHYMFEC
jgi:hypothetical protein